MNGYPVNTHQTNRCPAITPGNHWSQGSGLGTDISCKVDAQLIRDQRGTFARIFRFSDHLPRRRSRATIPSTLCNHRDTTKGPPSVIGEDDGRIPKCAQNRSDAIFPAVLKAHSPQLSTSESINNTQSGGGTVVRCHHTPFASKSHTNSRSATLYSPPTYSLRYHSAIQSNHRRPHHLLAPEHGSTLFG